MTKGQVKEASLCSATGRAFAFRRGSRGRCVSQASALSQDCVSQTGTRGLLCLTTAMASHSLQDLWDFGDLSTPPHMPRAPDSESSAPTQDTLLSLPFPTVGLARLQFEEGVDSLKQKRLPTRNPTGFQ